MLVCAAVRVWCCCGACVWCRFMLLRVALCLCVCCLMFSNGVLGFVIAVGCCAPCVAVVWFVLVCFGCGFVV